MRKSKLDKWFKKQRNSEPKPVIKYLLTFPSAILVEILDK
jgi:hypothetical protein